METDWRFLVAICLQIHLAQAGRVAVDIDGHRQSRDMARAVFHVDSQGRITASQALGSDAQVIYFLKQVLFQLGIDGIGIGRTGRPEMRPLGQYRHTVKVTAHAHPDDNGRTGIGSGVFHRLDYEFLDAVNAG